MSASWPEMIQFDEIKDRLIHEGQPYERVLQIHSELRYLPAGQRYLVSRPSGNVRLVARGDGWYGVETPA